jgi:hypothetical protein
MSRPDENRLAEWAELVGASVPDCPEETTSDAAASESGTRCERSG